MSGARTKLSGADNARTSIAGTSRLKLRLRPATPQTGGAKAARNNDIGCRAAEAGLREPPRLRIALSPTGYDMPWQWFDSDLFMGLAPPVATAPRYSERKKIGVAEHPEVFDHAGLLVNEPPGTAELPFS
jgi:hypothetical protein